MRITVAGAGNGGTTIAADLTLKGHQVTLLKTSDRMHSEHFRKLLDGDGQVVFHGLDGTRTAHIHSVTTSFEDALSGIPDLVILYVQTNYHEPVIRKLAPYLKKEQVVLLEPGYLSSASFLKYCGSSCPVLVEAESSPVDCRVVAPGEVRVFFRNVRNPIGVYPASRRSATLRFLEPLGYSFAPLDSVAEAALHNPNLIVHTIGAIMSIPRIEYTDGDYWMYKEVFTPSIWNLVEQLDQEKMAVLQALGLRRLSYVEACKYRNAQDLSENARDVFQDFASHHSISGPHESDSRYITEDVPEGLVLLESLGQELGMKTPVCSALIEIASACLQVDFRMTGRTLDRLGRREVSEILGSPIYPQ